MTLNISFDIDDKVFLSKKAQIALLKMDKVSTKVSIKYADFADVFLPKLAVELFKRININNYVIEFMND